MDIRSNLEVSSFVLCRLALKMIANLTIVSRSASQEQWAVDHQYFDKELVKVKMPRYMQPAQNKENIKIKPSDEPIDLKLKVREPKEQT